MSNRRKSRELALEVLYAWEMSGEDMDDVFEKLSVRNQSDELQPDTDSGIQRRLDRNGLAFTRVLTTLVREHRERIDTVIRERSTNWDLSRVALLDKQILRIAIAEIFYQEDIPPKVSIDEAIELAKKYSTENSGKFVNGILDSIAFQQKKE